MFRNISPPFYLVLSVVDFYLVIVFIDYAYLEFLDLDDFYSQIGITNSFLESLL